MHFIFPTAASSLSLLTMQRVCYNWLEQIYWIGMRRYYRSRVCLCVLLILLIFIFSENECSKPLMYLIYVNRTRLNMLRSIWFRKINIFLYIVAFWQHLVVILLAWLILCRRQCSCYASVNSSCAQPPPPPALGYCGAFARLVSPGGGAFANFALPGDQAFANPGAISELLTRTQFPIRI